MGDKKTKEEKWKMTFGYISEQEVSDWDAFYSEIDIDAYSQFGFCFADKPVKPEWFYLNSERIQ